MNTIAYDQPASYTIYVMGVLDHSWSDRLGGMVISLSHREGQPVTRLSGRLADQCALAGVLTALHELGFTLLSLEMLEGPGHV
jgi:hypothetical protein